MQFEALLKLGYLLKNMGISVMVIGLLIRILMLPLQIKTVKQSENMKKIQPEIAKIEKKYQNKTDNDSLMMKSQETMMLYKKYNINPMSSCLLAFIQLPLFFAFLQAIYKIPAIYEGEIFGKPKDRNEAIKMLKEIQGDVHTVYTSLAILIEESAIARITVKIVPSFGFITALYAVSTAFSVAKVNVAISISFSVLITLQKPLNN